MSQGAAVLDAARPEPELRPWQTIVTPVRQAVGPMRDRRLLLAALVALDVLALTIAVVGAGLLRSWLDLIHASSTPLAERHFAASLVVGPVLLLIFHFQGLYDFDRILAGTREYARIAHAATYSVVLAVAASYFAGGEPLISRSWLVLVWGLSIGCVGLARFSLRRAVRWLRRRGALRTRVAIVGASSLGVAIAQQLRAATNEGLDVVGFLDEYIPLGQRLLDEVAVIGRPSDLVHNLEADPADEYVLVPQALPHERLQQLTQLMVSRDGPVVRLAVSSSDLLTNGVLVTHRGRVPLVTLRRASITGLDAVAKRALDLLGAVLGLALLALPVGAVLLRALASGGRPLLWRQEVYGAGGERIWLWLLARGASTWLPLRGAPALLAVLRGQLSLVGPRPVACQPGWSAPPDWLTAAKPGLTGPWRLGGAEASLADQAVQDLAYVRNYTIWEDLHVLWETARRLHPDEAAQTVGRWQQSRAPGSDVRVWP